MPAPPAIRAARAFRGLQRSLVPLNAAGLRVAQQVAREAASRLGRGAGEYLEHACLVPSPYVLVVTSASLTLVEVTSASGELRVTTAWTQGEAQAFAHMHRLLTSQHALRGQWQPHDFLRMRMTTMMAIMVSRKMMHLVGRALF